MKGISAPVRRASSLSTMWGHSKKWLPINQEESIYQETDYTGISDAQIPEMCLLFEAT